MTLDEMREAKRVEFDNMLRQREERRQRYAGRKMTKREEWFNAATVDIPDCGVIFAEWDGSKFTRVWAMFSEGC